MQKIPINLAAPGMKLAKAVTKENGMTIMAEGMELTDSLIARLEGMNIERITVQGHPVEMGGAGAGTHWGERRDRLDHLFRRYAEDKWMMRVKERMRQYFQIKAAAQEAKMQAVKQVEGGDGPDGGTNGNGGDGHEMDDDLKTQVKGEILQVKDLPTLPHVLDKITQLVEDPDASTEAIAKVISTDQVPSAKVLKMVNSPIYGFPGRISSIQHAPVLLGFNVVRGIIISTSVFDMMVQAMKGLWEHSLGCATACNIIARRAGFEDPEEYAVAGLLHDPGKVVTAVQLPDTHAAILDTVQAKDLTYFQAEKDVLGFGHDRINAWLARHWGLPPNIREAMTRHHAPQLAEFYKPMSCVVHLGDFLVRLLEFGNSGDDQTAYLRPEALIELKFRMSDPDKVMDEMAGQLLEVSDVTF